MLGEGWCAHEAQCWLFLGSNDDLSFFLAGTMSSSTKEKASITTGSASGLQGHSSTSSLARQQFASSAFSRSLAIVSLVQVLFGSLPRKLLYKLEVSSFDAL